MDRSIVNKNYSIDPLVVNQSALNKILSGIIVLYNSLIRLLWWAFLVFLPVTSFPYFPETIGGGAVVQPLSLYPLAILVILFTLPYIVSRPIPKTFFTLVPFLLIALASSLFSLFRGIEPVLGIPVYERTLRTLITLGVGVSIYFTVSVLPRNLKDLNASLRWLYFGLALVLVWGSIQAVYVLGFRQSWFDKISYLQQFVSTRHLFYNRISGLTYEPNWFAEQICFLFLPWLFASVSSKRSVFNWRIRWFTAEWLLLIWSMLLLPLTYSRAGVLNLLAVSFFVWFLYRLGEWRNSNIQHASLNQFMFHRFRRLIRFLIETAIIISVIAVPIFLVGNQNAFFARSWNYWMNDDTSIAGYLDYLGFGARIAYSKAALETYQANPLIGVGLGNYAYYFADMLPYQPLSEAPEVLHLITPGPGRNRLITAKIFYLRLLAETGAIGLAAFLAFLTAVFGCALYLWYSNEKEYQFWGIAGLCGIFSFIIASFTYDSFAIPNMWVVFGFITSAAWISKRER